MPAGAIAGAEVAVRRDRLVLRPLTPVPGLWDAMVLHPDYPWVYRVEFPRYDKTWRVVFTDDMPPRLLLDVLSFQKRPGWRNPAHAAVDARRPTRQPPLGQAATTVAIFATTWNKTASSPWRKCRPGQQPMRCTGK